MDLDLGAAWDVLQRLAPAETPVAEQPRVIAQREKARDYVSVPVEMSAKNDGTFYVDLYGKLVASGEPNRNGALWTNDDLQWGVETLAGSPVNFAHEAWTVVGAIRWAAFWEDSATSGHIEIYATLWNWLYPGVIATVREEWARGGAFLSMECVSEYVSCQECGRALTYEDSWDPTKQCEHARTRSAAQRLVNPIFLGAALILPPTEPGWSGATVDWVQQRVAAYAERAV